MIEGPLETGRSSTVESHSGDAAFIALRNGWPRLAPTTGHLAAFGTYDWFDAARRWQFEGSEIIVLSASRAGATAVVLPLVASVERRFRVPIRQRAFLAVPDTQACDVIASSHATHDEVAAIADRLMDDWRQWDTLRLRFLPPDNLVSTVLRRAFERRGFSTVSRTVTGNLFVALDGAWNAYYGTRGRRLKKANNLAANRLAKSGAVRIDWLEPGTGEPADAERVLAQAIDVSARSWKRATGNSLDRQGPRAFIEELTRSAHANGTLSIWLLSLDDLPIAMEYQLIAGANVYALRSDYDTAYEELSPGSHLNHVILQRLFGRRLRRYYMGPGENAYKRRWTEDVEPVGELVVWSRTSRGRALAVLERRVRPLAARVRERLRARRAEPAGDDASLQESARP